VATEATPPSAAEGTAPTGGALEGAQPGADAVQGDGEGRGGRRRRRGRRGRRGGAGRETGAAAAGVGEAADSAETEDLDDSLDDGVDTAGDTAAAAQPAEGSADTQGTAPQSALDLVPPPPREAASGISWTGLATDAPAAEPAQAEVVQPEALAPAETAALVAGPETAVETPAPVAPEAAAEPSRVVWSSSPTSYGGSSSRRDDY
jgi:ribonuclease E